MTEQEIKNRVLVLIRQDMGGISSENPKVDFKRDWYNLKEKKGKNEFIKDVTAMVNTTGLEGMIVIGYSESRKNRIGEIIGAKFSDSQLEDDSHIQNIIISHCSNVFAVNHYSIEIDGKHLSVLIIPPIISKPILCIKNYRWLKNRAEPIDDGNKIFVRRGTATAIANKDDIDRMYFEREYLKPEYEYEINLIGNLRIAQPKGILLLHINIQIENIGRRPLVVTQGTGTIEFFDSFDEKRITTIDLDQKDSKSLPVPIDIISSSETEVWNLRYRSQPINNNGIEIKNPIINLVFLLSNGQKLVSKNKINGTTFITGKS